MYLTLIDIMPSAKEWDKSPSGTCKGERKPVPGLVYPSPIPPAAAVVDEVLSGMSVKAELLDITRLSQLRKDGHPSIYGIERR